MPQWIKMFSDKPSDQEFNSLNPQKVRWRILLYKLVFLMSHACLHIHTIHVCMYTLKNKHFSNVTISLTMCSMYTFNINMPVPSHIECRHHCLLS